MEEYILESGDRARVIDGDTTELFTGGRTMIFFSVSDLSRVQMMTDVPTEYGRQDALRFTGSDSLLSKPFSVLIPRAHPDFAALCAALKETAAQERYEKAACAHDGTGAHHRH